MNRLEGLLQEWGRSALKFINYADEYGENTLYRAGILGGKVQYKSAGHKVLCPNVSRAVRTLDTAIWAYLSENEQNAIGAWYIMLATEREEPVKLQQVAELLDISYSAMRKRLTRARKKLRQALTTV